MTRIIGEESLIGTFSGSNLETVDERQESHHGYDEEFGLYQQQQQQQQEDEDESFDRIMHRGPQQVLPRVETEFSETSSNGETDMRKSSSSLLGDDEEEISTDNAPKKRGTSVSFQSSSKRSLSEGEKLQRSKSGKNNNVQASPHGQNAKIRKPEMRNAMDKNDRYRYTLRKRVASYFEKLLGKTFHDGDNENYDDADDDGSIKSIMHGRLMVKPSKRLLNVDTNATFDVEEEKRKRAETQYKLTKTNGSGVPGMYENTSSYDDAESVCCPSSERSASMALHWAFRMPFCTVFIATAFGWLTVTSIFAFFIWIIATFQPYCIGGVEFENSTSKFVDSYQLSWTTFSTVGFGLIYPELSTNHTPIQDCTAITMLTAFESFVGVLFSSLCSALLFAKLARVQSFAQVKFSDPMVIRYGSGLFLDEDSDDEEKHAFKEMDRKDPTQSHIPCPVLEFRIFNQLSSVRGGEIIDASISMVASINASQADTALQRNRNARRKRGRKKRSPERSGQSEPPLNRNFQPPTSAANVSGSVLNTYAEVRDKEEEWQAKARQSLAPHDTPLPLHGPAPALIKRRSHSDKASSESISQQLENTIRLRPSLSDGRGGIQGHGLSGHSDLGWKNSVLAGLPGVGIGGRVQQNYYPGAHELNRVSSKNVGLQAYEEDPSGKICSKKVLAKLEVESPDHPFFRRVWLVRHTLDMNSLLLKPHVRLMLQHNRGFWPKELNNYESIRASIAFDQILINVSGTSNVDAHSVFAHHVYHMADVNVGYRFVNALYRSQNGSLLLDHTLLNDVEEQVGGGGQPLDPFDPEVLQDILVL